MILCVPHDHAEDIAERLRGLGERPYVIGAIERKTPEEPPLLLDPGSQARPDEG
jgi:phosphoribosylaminoimidazole (AIR) synthetase